MVLLRAVGDTSPPPTPNPGSLQVNGYDWAARVLHSSTFIQVRNFTRLFALTYLGFCNVFHTYSVWAIPTY